MNKTISIYEAKTNLSKYIQQAKAGKPVSIGSYGKEEVLLVAAPKIKPLKLGIWAHKKKGYKDGDIIGPDTDHIKEFKKSVSKPFPKQ